MNKIVQFQRTESGTIYLLTEDGELWCAEHFGWMGDRTVPAHRVQFETAPASAPTEHDFHVPEDGVLF